jgi:hypothetical protein
LTKKSNFWAGDSGWEIGSKVRGKKAKTDGIKKADKVIFDE